MAGVDSAGLGEVLQNVLASFSLADRERLVQVRSLSLFLPPLVFPDTLCLDAERVSYRYASTNARSLGALKRDAAANSPARDAAPHCVCHGSFTGRVARHG
jgi:hypothetical protein